ncbi:MAG: UDP-N-acetylglucosamine 2-epimerase (non-hydrolyzing) [Sutterellaceae bacterium]|nr:UDP-N-acetylglucosamine 2-epimerase (non-hydrolyzing) [Burkholderiaceae bacterium]MCX7901466.1 UDP-N-acetylglucosamine 2-epimerase (non-hydrolyzing) [Burkholderiaceae bacterium]MDW8429325.1 UDP-N-acetylglucosamine 2-epimerase (non-hydrolyzing) [Sutterellaceae bacterium]
MTLRESLLGPVLCVVGARPNYMKMAPLLRAFRKQPSLPRAVLVHTGQHYDYALNDRLFQDLELPAPDVNLAVGSGSHAVQTAEVMKRFEPVVDALKPSAVLVVGDVNSTLACSLVAAKKGVAVIHVEAGLRSFDRSMPEEINRVLTDQLADLLYTTERSAHENLAREGIPPQRIAFVGNLMIDSLHAALPKAVPAEEVVRRAGADPACVRQAHGYGVVTLHRPSNVDEPAALVEVLDILRAVAARLPLVWPIHPRTRASIERAGLMAALAHPRLICLPPQGYLEMVGLLARATVVLTDSGGVQEETTALGVPCLTLRQNTERPITIEQGTNTLVGRDRAKILTCIDEILRNGGKRGRIPELWDGRSADRIADHLSDWLRNRSRAAT